MIVQFILPCKNHVKHYLQLRFGNPCQMRNDSFIGKYFFELTKSNSQSFDKNFKIEQYASELTIRISQDLFLRKTTLLTKTNVIAFNTFVATNFMHEINIMLDTLIEFNGMEIKQAIECIYEKYNMDEAILTYDNIKKNYYRYKKRPKAA